VNDNAGRLQRARAPSAPRHVDRGASSVLASYVSGSVLNGILLLQILWYWNASKAVGAAKKKQ
jgi:hypothetical protein